jgi:BNR/Asp-box repeat
MRVAFGRVALVLFLLGIIPERALLADPITLLTRPDRLAEHLGWLNRTVNGESCASGFGNCSETSLFSDEATTMLAASRVMLPPANKHLPSSSGVLLPRRITHENFDGWKPLKVGAGGLITGIDIARDGTKVIRTDTYGAYVRKPGTLAWNQLVSVNSIAPTDAIIQNAQGVYEIAIAPSRTSRFYMYWNGRVYRTDDSGASWSRTDFSQATAKPNDYTKGFGSFIAVDPANADVVYVGTPSHGLFSSANAGGAWSQVGNVGTSKIPSGSGQGGGHLIAFDPSSGTIDGKTQGIYVSTYGTGVYHSTDGGITWTLTLRTPTTHRHMVVASDGWVWFTDDSNSQTTLWWYDGSSWTHSSVSGGPGIVWASVAVDPADPARIVIGAGEGQIDVSRDHGSTWTGVMPVQNRVATDVPWLAWTAEDWMTNGNMVFDPSASNRLFFAEGIGVWWSNPPNSDSRFNWNSESAGIEQLVGDMVIAPPGGKPNVFSWDRPQFYVRDPDRYPSTHGPNNVNPVVGGWSADWASTSPSTLVAIMNSNVARIDVSGKSSDGGRTWSAFGSIPPEILGKGLIGGGIAASTDLNFVWFPVGFGGKDNNPYYTKDGGLTWLPCNIPGVPTVGFTGWGSSFYQNRQIVAADRVLQNTFYAYNVGAGADGVYKSSDGGANWSRVFSGPISAYSNVGAQLRSVPGNAGHLFFTGAAFGAPLMRSFDGGAHWIRVGMMSDVLGVGFGATFAGKNYPAIFVAGINGDEYGIWQSIDNAAKWTKIGDYPLGSFDIVKWVEGDKDIVGRVYVGFSGSGFAYKAQ